MAAVIFTKEDVGCGQWTFFRIRKEASDVLFPGIEVPEGVYLNIKIREEDGKLYAFPYSREVYGGPGAVDYSITKWEKYHKYFSEEEQKELRCEVIPATLRNYEEREESSESEPEEITKEQARELFPWLPQIVDIEKLNRIVVSDDWADALAARGWDDNYDAGMMGSRWDKGEYTAIYESDNRFVELDGKKDYSWAENSISDLKHSAPTVEDQIKGSPSHILLWMCSGCSFDDTPTERSLVVYVTKQAGDCLR